MLISLLFIKEALISHKQDLGDWIIFQHATGLRNDELFEVPARDEYVSNRELWAGMT